VGIEAALHGIPVVTAGTGRYDRRGFTLDSSSREEYLDKLANLQSYARLTSEQIEFAGAMCFSNFLLSALRAFQRLNSNTTAMRSPRQRCRDTVGRVSSGWILGT
jgi:hypothetical protein